MFTPYAYEKLEPITNKDNMLKALNRLNKDYCDCKMGPAGLNVGYTSPGTSLDYAYDQLKVPYSYAFEIYSQYNDIPAVSKELLLLQTGAKKVKKQNNMKVKSGEKGWLSGFLNRLLC